MAATSNIWQFWAIDGIWACLPMILSAMIDGTFLRFFTCRVASLGPMPPIFTSWVLARGRFAQLSNDEQMLSLHEEQVSTVF